MYTCPERVIRDGFLVAFAGEVMTEAEARRRGVFEETKPAKKPARRTSTRRASK